MDDTQLQLLKDTIVVLEDSHNAQYCELNEIIDQDDGDDETYESRAYHDGALFVIRKLRPIIDAQGTKETTEKIRSWKSSLIKSLKENRSGLISLKETYKGRMNSLVQSQISTRRDWDIREYEKTIQMIEAKINLYQEIINKVLTL